MSETTTQTRPDGASSPAVRFDDLDLDERLLRAVAELGFEHPTPIQAEAIPHLMQGRDIIGGARTGSGKTAAFGLPLVHRVRDGGKAVRALVLAPTRELARQVADALDALARHLPIKILTIYGGVGYKQQLRGLKQGVSVVVGTPGRVLDHIGSGALDLSGLEVLVLDEADEMLQMGFIDDIEQVLEASNPARQIALFSATMPAAIERVAKKYLDDPVQVQVENQGLSASHINQHWVKVHHRGKTEALARILMAEERDASLVFARTRAGVAKLAEELSAQGFAVDAIHGDLNQAARELVLSRLRARKVDVVVATDVAARGLDVDHITHVFNYDMPHDAETYVHRIGRTARAGREGSAITFVTGREQRKLGYIRRDVGDRIERMQVPDDAQIAARQRARLVDELDEAMDAAGSEHAEAWLGELLGETGWSAPEVAAAALSLLALERNFDVRSATPAPQQIGVPRATRGDEAPEHFDHLNEVELFFAGGRRDGLRPADFVGALCHDAGLSGDVIGRITLGGHKAFVGLPREVAEALLQKQQTLEVRGKDYPLQLSFQSRSDDAPGRRSSSKHGGRRSSGRRNSGRKNSRRKNSRRKSSAHSKGYSGKKSRGKKSSNKNKGKRRQPSGKG